MQQLLKAQDLATMFNVSPRTVLNWYRRGIIPARVHVGHVIRFDLDEVLTALEEAREEPLADEFFRDHRRRFR